MSEHKPSVVSIINRDGKQTIYTGHEDRVIGKTYHAECDYWISETNTEVHIWEAGTGKLVELYPVYEKETVYFSENKNWLLMERNIEQSWGSQIELRLFYIGSENVTTPGKGLSISSTSEEFTYWLEPDNDQMYLFTGYEDDLNGECLPLTKYRLLANDGGLTRVVVDVISDDEKDYSENHLRNFIALTL